MLLIESLLARLGCQIDKLSFARGSAAIDSLSRRINGIGNASQNTKRTLGDFLSPVIKGFGIYAAAMTGFVAATVNAAQSAKSAAVATGTTTQAIQELHYAARRAGVETSTLDKALINITKNAYLASRAETSPAKTFFFHLGVNVRDSQHQLKKADTLLEDIAEKWNTFSAPKRTSVLKMVAGETGASEKSLALLIAKGKQGIRELRREAIRSGTIIPPKTLEAADKTREAFMDMAMAFRGISYGIGAELLDDYTRGLKHVAEWLKKNREEIIKTVTGPMKVFNRAVQTLTENVNLLKTAIGALVAYKTTLFLFTNVVPAAIFAVSHFGTLAAIALKGMTTAMRALVVSSGPVLILATLIYLVYDEIITMFRNGRTVIGSFMDQLNRLIDTDWEKLNAIGKILKTIATITGYKYARDRSKETEALAREYEITKEIARVRKELIRQGKWDFNLDSPAKNKKKATPPVQSAWDYTKSLPKHEQKAPAIPALKIDVGELIKQNKWGPRKLEIPEVIRRQPGISTPRVFTDENASPRMIPRDRPIINNVTATFNITNPDPGQAAIEVNKKWAEMMEDPSLTIGGIYPTYTEESL